MNYEQPPPYAGPGPGYAAPTAPAYPGYPTQGYQGQYQGQGYPVPADGANPAYPTYQTGPPGAYPAQPGYQGYPVAPQPQYGWQNAPPGAMYGEAPKNTVYVVEQQQRPADTGSEQACLTACMTALCCCCLWDMMT